MDDDDGDVVVIGVDLDNNNALGRKGIGYNGCLKYRRRSIGLERKSSPLSVLSSDDVESPFSERISLIRKDFDADDIDWYSFTKGDNIHDQTLMII